MSIKFKKNIDGKLEVEETKVNIKSYTLIGLTSRKTHLEETKTKIVGQMNNEISRLDSLISDIDELITEANNLNVE